MNEIATGVTINELLVIAGSGGTSTSFGGRSIGRGASHAIFHAAPAANKTSALNAIIHNGHFIPRNPNVTTNAVLGFHESAGPRP